MVPGGGGMKVCGVGVVPGLWLGESRFVILVLESPCYRLAPRRLSLTPMTCMWASECI